MKRYEVEMWAFESGKIRIVTVPEEDSTQQGLSAIFYYGQNDFCLDVDYAQRLPSVSVGDIIRYEGARHVVGPIGFIEVAADFRPPASDRGGMYAYGLKKAG